MESIQSPSGAEHESEVSVGESFDSKHGAIDDLVQVLTSEHTHVHYTEDSHRRNWTFEQAGGALVLSMVPSAQRDDQDDHVTGVREPDREFESGQKIKKSSTANAPVALQQDIFVGRGRESVTMPTVGRSAAGDVAGDSWSNLDVAGEGWSNLDVPGEDRSNPDVAGDENVAGSRRDDVVNVMVSNDTQIRVHWLNKTINEVTMCVCVRACACVLYVCARRLTR